VDGGSRLRRGGGLGGGRERRHVQVPGDAAAAGAVPEADHRALGLPEDERAGPRGRPAVLPQEQRARETGPPVRPREPDRAARAADRSEYVVGRRLALARLLCARAWRPLRGLHRVRGRGRLADGEGAGPHDRKGPRRRGQVDALLRARLDQGRQGLLLFTLPGAAGGEGARGGALGAGALLPSRRHAAGAGHPRLRAQGPAGLVRRRRRDRGRPLAPDCARRGLLER
jgi:hypothetical protein